MTPDSPVRVLDTSIPVRVEFNQAQAVIDDLAEQVALQVKQASFARASAKELNTFIAGNAHLLGMDVGTDGVARMPSSPRQAPDWPRQVANLTAQLLDKDNEIARLHELLAPTGETGPAGEDPALT